MLAVLIVAACVVSQSYAQYILNGGGQGYDQYQNVPNPYQFSYEAPADGGSSSHQEQGDGQGRVTGSYTVTDDDGRSRTVNYVADEGGFRADIVTNEPGTANQNPADVNIQSSADQGPQSYGAPQGISYGAAQPAVNYVVVPNGGNGGLAYGNYY